MGMRINTNIEAFNAQRNLNTSGISYAKSVEKLSSGMRINRAGDDAAGLSISEKLRAQVKGLGQAARNAQDGISMIQTGEGALNEVHSMLQRMRELAVQGSNDTLSTDDRTAIGTELTQLKDEIDAVSSRTKFNGQALLTGAMANAHNGSTLINNAVTAAGAGSASIANVNISEANAGGGAFALSSVANSGNLTLTQGGVSQTIAITTVAAGQKQSLNFDALGVSFDITQTATGTAANTAELVDNLTLVLAAGSGNAKFQIGADAGQTMSVAFDKVDATATSLNITAAVGTYVAGASTTTANALITALDTAITSVSTKRSNLGAAQNRLEHTIANLGVASENLTASESRIRDVDMAAEMVNFTKTGILQQAGQAILAQANQAPQGVLSLLR